MNDLSLLFHLPFLHPTETSMTRKTSPLNSRASFALRPCAHAAALVVSLLAAQSALAQSEPSKLDRVEITGSSIKRVDAETALPVQVIKREDIERSGGTTAAERLSKVSASAAALTDGASFSDIAGQRGFSGANLRGIGVSSTLVLLNGRRLANFASPGGNAGVDLNSIPSAAIQRVEVLKDGASAIYGSDAIGGVINFITRTDYEGADGSVYASATQHGGAGKNSVTLAGGVGNLANDKFNLFGVMDLQNTQALRSTQRDWIGSAYQPDINLDVASSNTFPANVRALNSRGSPTGSRYNPSIPNCNGPATVYRPDSFVGSKACMYDYMYDTEISPASKRASVLARGQYALSADNTLFAEFLTNSTTTNYRISPLTITDLNYPLAGKYYPVGLIPGTPTALRVNMRLTEAGGRTNDVDAVAQRLVVGAKGLVAGWDYDTALNYSVNTVADKYVDGYVKRSTFNSAFATGNINPFGPSDAAGLALLNSTKISDAARDSKGTTAALDAKASRELFEMGGGSAAIATGLEVRRETMAFTPSALLLAGEIRGDAAAVPIDGARTVTAAFVELNLPVSKTLEAQVALRHDSYSDVGSTTNPKAGVRWTPAKEVVVRGSMGSGFRAPSLADLYTPTNIGQTNGVYDDPLGCGKVSAADKPDYCGIQPDKLRGGSPDLKPEKSKQFSLGIVLEPSRTFSTSFDYWRLEKTDVIVAPEGSYFTDPVRNAAYIKRDSFSPAPGVPGFITQIDSRLRNIGSLQTSGVDVNVDWRLPASSLGKMSVVLNGTYVIDYTTQEGAGAKEVSAVGVFANDQVVQKWRHTLSFNWDQGPWSATLQQTFYLGYKDQNPNPDGTDRSVNNYALWDLTGSYSLSKATKIRAGIKNLLDTNPPSSNQVYSFLAGYDPNYTDPKGRAVYVSLNHSFK
ncbi:MAG: TonB-dependent receptor [Burkholderiales bacterium PBB4]|nr:MAG: TonB-dependent receptor [Burkholderiales bacterium PBB4]